MKIFLFSTSGPPVLIAQIDWHVNLAGNGFSFDCCLKMTFSTTVVWTKIFYLGQKELMIVMPIIEKLTCYVNWTS